MFARNARFGENFAVPQGLEFVHPSPPLTGYPRLVHAINTPGTRGTKGQNKPLNAGKYVLFKTFKQGVNKGPDVFCCHILQFLGFFKL